MKTAFIHLEVTTSQDANSVISQLNYLSKNKDTKAVPFSRFLHAASKKGTTGIGITLTDCTKKEAVLTLRDIIRTYKAFKAQGNVSFIDPLQKREVKIISLPINYCEEDATQTVDKLNKICHSKFSKDDLIV